MLPTDFLPVRFLLLFLAASVGLPSQTPSQAPAPSSSAPASRNPTEIVRSSKTIYIREKPGGAWDGFPGEPLEKKILENKDFTKLGFVIVNNSADADILITLDRVAVSWDCTYRMTHPASGTVLGAGKAIAWDCIRAAPSIADQIVSRLKQLYEGPPPVKESPAKQAKP